MSENISTMEYKTMLTSDEALDIDMKIFNSIKKYDLQSMNKVAVEAIVDRLNLEPFYEFLILFNGSNDLPYHNLYHAECMLLNCYEGAWLLHVEDEDELRGLCAAALLHDFNHTGGKQKDVENIKIALGGLKLAQTYASSKLMGLSPRAFEIAENAIKVTLYPFEYQPETMAERIIRDADLMQAYEKSPFKLLTQFLGLKEEIEVMHKSTFTAVEFATAMKNFQDDIEWHTRWGAEKAVVRNWDLIKSDLATLVAHSS